MAAGFTAALDIALKKELSVIMTCAAGLSFSSDKGFNIRALLTTDKSKSWIKKGKLVVDSSAVIFSAQDGDQKIGVPTMLALTREISGNEQRIVIAVDAELRCFSNRYFPS